MFKRKGLLTDAALVLIAALFCFWFWWRTRTILVYHFDWAAVPRFLARSTENGFAAGILLQGLITTLRLSLWGAFLGIIFGCAAALFRLGNVRFLRWLAASYVAVMRNTPPLVLLFLFYFFISTQVFPLDFVEDSLRDAPEWVQSLCAFLLAPVGTLHTFISAIIALGAYEGAYIAEIVRGGILSVPKGQWEASSSLGMKRSTQMRLVIFPQALRVITPPLVGQLISTIKDSAIVSAISVRELTFQGQELMASTYMTFEVWTMVTLLYLCLTLSCSLIGRKLERVIAKNMGRERISS